jgi:hypothetical protein
MGFGSFEKEVLLYRAYPPLLLAFFICGKMQAGNFFR